MAIPYVPSSVSVTRINDTQISMTWTNNAVTGRPVSSHTVQMRRLEGSSWSTWETKANPAGTASSYSQVGNGLKANVGVQFRIRANNGEGSSAWVESGYLWMTPDPPSWVSAAASPGGISITWNPTHYVGGGIITQEISRNKNDGSGWVVLNSSLSQVANSYTDNSPGTTSNYYRIRVKQSQNLPLWSLYTMSNLVSAIAPPLAPTNLYPNGQSLDVTVAFDLTWIHRDSGDGSPQSEAEVQYSDDEGTSWNTLYSGPLTAQKFTVPAGLLSNGENYIWRVRTRGSTTQGYGPFSENGTFFGLNGPSVIITSPPAVIDSGPLVVSWEYSQPDGHPQVYWVAYVWNEDMTSLLDYKSGSTESSVTMQTPLQDGDVYTIYVAVRSSDNLWASSPLHTVTVELPSPPMPHVDGQYDDCTGTVLLSVWADKVVAGVTEPIVGIDLQRSINGGSWVTFATGIQVSENAPLVYSEDFDVNLGGWGPSSTPPFSTPSAVSRTTVYTVDSSPGALDVTWGPGWGGGLGQFASHVMTGLTPGKIYTFVATVLNQSSAGRVCLATDTGARSKTIDEADGFSEGTFGSRGMGGWEIVTLSFTATSESHEVGLLGLSPSSGSHTYLGRGHLYEGSTTGYSGSRVVTAVVDPIPITNGRNSYRAIARSANGASTISEITTVPGTDGQPGSGFWVFLAYGESFSKVIRLAGNLSLSATTDRARASHHFQGRRLPVLMTGPQIQRTVNVKGTAFYDVDDCPSLGPCDHDSPRDDWEAAAWDATVVCYRDHTGRRMFGLLGEVSTEDARPGIADITFSVSETTYSEQRGGVTPLGAGV